MKKPFCIAPWTHAYSNPDGSRQLCCVSGDQHETDRFQTLEEYRNSDYMKDVRRRMMDNNPPDKCVAMCGTKDGYAYRHRQQYAASLTDSALEKLIAETSRDGFIARLPTTFDYRLSNMCNYKCRMCSGKLSSAIESEERKNKTDSENRLAAMLHNPIKKYRDNLEAELWNAIRSNRVTEIYWAGGEPLLWPVHWEMMNYLIDNNQTDVKIRYNSNLSILEHKGVKIYDLLNKFDNYLFYASYDEIGDIAEYIRHGVVHSEWLTRFDECYNNMHIGISYTLTIPGLASISEFDNFIKAYPKILLSFNTASGQLDPRIIPTALFHDWIDNTLSTVRHFKIIDYLSQLRNELMFDITKGSNYELYVQKAKRRVLALEGTRPSTVTIGDIMYRISKDIGDWWRDI